MVHWVHGESTTIDNRVLLCCHHHSFVHERGYGIGVQGEGRSTLFRFFDRCGHVIQANLRKMAFKFPVPAEGAAASANLKS